MFSDWYDLIFSPNIVEMSTFDFTLVLSLNFFSLVK